MKVSDEVMFLEEAFDVLNQKYFESALQRVAITIQSTPTAHGHFTPWNSWEDSGEHLKEINLGAESLKRPVAEVIATLLHEMVNYYCHVNGIKDTSRSGTYHNKRFKEECEKRDLIITKGNVIGFSLTRPTKELCQFVGDHGWEERIRLYRNSKGRAGHRVGGSPKGGEDTGKAVEKKSSTRKYICPICSMSVRATKVVHIACMDCGNVQMIPVERECFPPADGKTYGIYTEY